MAERDRAAGAGGSRLTDDRAVAAVRVHLDRVHDAVLRAGCAPADAVDVVRATALSLVERSAAGPCSADEAVGRWFADAHASARQVAGPATVPAGDDRQRGVQSALDGLPEQERLAVLLRDAYDLPLPAVAAALGTDAPAAERALERARREVPEAAALTGLTVLGMPPAARADVLRTVEDLAAQRLPRARPGPGSRRVTAVAPVEAVPADPPARLLSPLLAGLSVVLAVLAGTGVGLVLGRQDEPRPLTGAASALPSGVAYVSPQPSITAVPAPPTVEQTRPRTDVVVVPPPPLPTPTPTPTPSPTPSAVPAIALSPAGGTNATTITVTGTGFAPGAQVQVDYLDPAGAPTGSSAVAVADETGSITASLVAQDPTGVPGPHSVVATVDGAAVASEVFTAQ